MYNEELKARFIREYTESVKTAEALTITFKSLSKYEHALKRISV